MKILLLFCQFIMKTKQVGYVNVNVAMKLSQWGHVKSCGCISIKPKTTQRISSKVDLTGQQLDRIGQKRRRPSTHWWCQCKASIATGSLIGGHTHSCGCYQKERMTEIKKADLLGQRFGFITVIDSAPSRAGGQAYWKCQCDCGTIWEVATIWQDTIVWMYSLIRRAIYLTNFKRKPSSFPRTTNIFRYKHSLALFLTKKSNPFDGPQHQQSSEYFGGEDARSTITSKINTPLTIIESLIKKGII